MDSYLGEIRAFAFGFNPKNWALCNGQLLLVSQNTALFSLLGTTYGGNGSSTFGLPNLNGCIAVGQGQSPGTSNYAVGMAGGVANVILTPGEMAPHGHSLPASGSNAQKQPVPTSINVLGATGQRGDNTFAYVSAATQAGTSVTMGADAVSPAGGGQAHNNMAPYLAFNYCICLAGEFPQRP